MQIKSFWKEKINKKYFDFLYDGDEEVVLISGGRNTGKSFFGAIVSFLNVIEWGNNVICFRDTNASAERDQFNLFLEVGELLFEYDFKEIFKVIKTQSKFVHIESGKFIQCRGVGKNTTSLKSLGDIQFCWIDEASSFNSFEMKTLILSILNRGLKDNKVLLTSNIPSSKKHWLFQLFRDEKKGYKSLYTSYKDNYFLKDIEKVGNDLKALFKEGSNTYLREVLGIVPETSESLLISNYEYFAIGEKKFTNGYILFNSYAYALSLLFVALEHNKLYILGELELSWGKNFKRDIESFYNNLKEFYIDPENVFSIFFNSQWDSGSKGHLQIIFNTTNPQFLREPYTINQVKILNNSGMEIFINKERCKNFISEIESAEWAWSEEKEMFLDKLLENRFFKFIPSLRLVKGILNLN